MAQSICAMRKDKSKGYSDVQEDDDEIEEVNRIIQSHPDQFMDFMGAKFGDLVF